jgi:hypothetical protein
MYERENIGYMFVDQCGHCCHQIEVVYNATYNSSFISSNTDENELDALLKDFVLNPIEEVNF